MSVYYALFYILYAISQTEFLPFYPFRPSSPVNQSSLSRFHSMSVSCPDSNILRPIPSMPPSLPSSFRQENVFASPVYATRGRSAAAAAAGQCNSYCFSSSWKPIALILQMTLSFKYLAILCYFVFL